MRGIFVLLMVFFAVSVKSQTAFSGSYFNRMQQPFASNPILNDSLPEKKWFLTSSVGFSSSVIFSRGNSAFVQSVPFSFQLNRKLNNNWYAFAALTAAPSYVNFNQSFLSANPAKSLPNNSYLNNNQFALYGRAEAGLMYVNDKKTFSITGSIIVEKTNDPFLPYNQMDSRRRPNNFVPNHNSGLQ